MAGPQSYPSPTSAETQAGAPFYTSNASTSESVVPTSEVPDVSLDNPSREDINVSQLERLHNEIVAQIHPDLDNSASNVALAAATSAADAAAAIVASDMHQQLARKVMSLGRATSDADAEASHTPPMQIAEEGVMTSGDGPPGVTSDSPKIRSKSSRACDECRHRKIRCEPSGDESPCRSCAKNNLRCQFSRAHQKRGPQKGYIQQLNKRVETLEARFGESPGSSGTPTRRAKQSFLSKPEPVPITPVPNPAKRTRPVDEDHYNTENRGTAGSPPALELNETMVELYRMFIHPVLPILPEGLDNVRAYWNSVGLTTRNAFAAALEASVCFPHFTGDEMETQVSPFRAHELYIASRDDAKNLVQVQTLLLLAISADNEGPSKYHFGPNSGELLGMAVELAGRLDVDSIDRGDHFAGVPNQRYSPSVAIVVPLVTMHVMEQLSSRKDRKALRIFDIPPHLMHKEQLSNQVYWMSKLSSHLVEISRYRVIKGTATDAIKACMPLVAPTEEVEGQLLRDRTVFGSQETLIIRLVHRVLAKELELIESRSDCGPNNMVALMFHYVRIQIDLTMWPVASSRDLLASVRSTLDVLEALDRPNPLTYHFAAQATHLLFQLAELSDTRDEAERLLDVLDKAVNHYVPETDNSSFDALVRTALRQRNHEIAQHAAAAAAATAAATAASASLPTAAGGLQHLASAAIAGDDGVAGAAEAAEAAAAAAQAQMGLPQFDGELLDRRGYIHALMAPFVN